MKIKFNMNNISKKIFYLYIISVYVFSFQTKYVKYSEYIYISFICVYFLSFIKNRHIFINKSNTIILFFVIFCLVSSFWAINFSAAMSRSISLLILSTISFFMLQIYEIDDIKKILFTIFIAGFFMVFYTILDMGFNSFFSATMSGERIGGTISAANAYGIYLSLSFLCGLYCLKFGGYRKLKILFLLVVFMGILSSNSRNSFIVCCSGVVLFLLLGNTNIHRRKKASYLVFTLCIAYIIYDSGLLDSILLRMSNISFVNGNDRSVNSRMLMINVGYSIFANNPLWGCGINNAQFILEYYFARTYLHNNYIELLADLGLIGFCLYYLVYLYDIIGLIKYRRLKVYNELSSILIILLIMLLIADISVVFYYNKIVYVIFGTISILLTKNNEIRISKY